MNRREMKSSAISIWGKARFGDDFLAVLAGAQTIIEQMRGDALHFVMTDIQIVQAACDVAYAVIKLEREMASGKA